MRLFFCLLQVAIDIYYLLAIRTVYDEVMFFIFLSLGRSLLQEDELEVHANITFMLVDELLCQFNGLVIDQLVSGQLKQNDCSAFHK